MSTDTGFSVGFFCGMLLGAVGVYMVTTPEGKELRSSLTKEFKKHQQTLILETIMPPDTDKHPSSGAFRNLIKRVRDLIGQAEVEVEKKVKASPQSKKKLMFKQK